MSFKGFSTDELQKEQDEKYCTNASLTKCYIIVTWCMIWKQNTATFIFEVIGDIIECERGETYLHLKCSFVL